MFFIHSTLSNAWQKIYGQRGEKGNCNKANWKEYKQTSMIMILEDPAVLQTPGYQTLTEVVT